MVNVIQTDWTMEATNNKKLDHTSNIFSPMYTPHWEVPINPTKCLQAL